MFTRYLTGFLTLFVFLVTTIVAEEKNDKSADTELISEMSELDIFRYLLAGPPAVEPLFEKETKECMTDEGVSVCVVCCAQNETKYKLKSLENIDFELAQYTTFQLHAHKIKVVPPNNVRAWMEEINDWEKLGEVFKTTYVIDIELNEFSLHEEDNLDLYRGRAKSTVSVWKMDKAGQHARKVFSAEKTSIYPINQPYSARDKTCLAFKTEYLTRLSDEIGRFFYEYYPADEIASGQD